MKKIFHIPILFIAPGFFLFPLILYAGTTTVSNYYPSPSGNYTKVQLVNTATGGPNENYAASQPACFCAQSSNSYTQNYATNPGVNTTTLNCDTGASTTSTPVASGGTLATYSNAGIIFADPKTGYLEVCKTDGSVASYPGACFNRFGNSLPSPPCPSNYQLVGPTNQNQTFLLNINNNASSASITFWTCCFSGPSSISNPSPLYTKSGCFSIYGSSTNVPACNSNYGDPNAYEIDNCQSINSSTLTSPLYKRDCCFNASTGPFPLGTASTCACTPIINGTCLTVPGSWGPCVRGVQQCLKSTSQCGGAVPVRSCCAGVVDQCGSCNGICVASSDWTCASGECRCTLLAPCGTPPNCKKPVAGTCDCAGDLSASAACGGGGSPSGGNASSTPFLFTFKNGKYYIENDVMLTYKNEYYELAKQGYEGNSGDPRKFKQTDYYKIRLNPDLAADGIKLLLKEIEPEEDNIDQVRLVRVIHPQGSNAFVDDNDQSIKVTGTTKSITLKTCTMNDGRDCVKEFSAIDDQWLEGNIGQSFTATFDLSNLDRNNLYLSIHSWENDPPPLQPAPFKVKAPANASSLNIDIMDNTHPESVLYSLKDLHPRNIALSNNIFDLKEAVKFMVGNTLTIRFTWTAHHFVDYVGLIEAQSQEMGMEELPLIKAVKTGGADVLKELLTKDNVYAHLVRGEDIDLTFATPQKPLGADQQDSYFFVISGFYSGLRTYLYPNIDPSMDTFRTKLKEYVHQLETDGMLKNQKS